jgi:hypothetical protein
MKCDICGRNLPMTEFNEQGICPDCWNSAEGFENGTFFEEDDFDIAHDLSDSQSLSLIDCEGQLYHEHGGILVKVHKEPGVPEGEEPMYWCPACCRYYYLPKRESR